MQEESNKTKFIANNYILQTPYRISPCLIDDLAVIFGKSHLKKKQNNTNKSNGAKNQNNLYATSSHSSVCTVSSSKKSIHSYLKKGIKMLNHSFLRLNDFQRNRENVIIDTRYDYNKYEKSLMKLLVSSKNENEALTVLTQLWRDLKFCDLIFIVSGKQYLAHRLVVALYSQKYKSYFELHKYDFVTRVSLTESSQKALQQVLTFLYTNQILINIKTIDAILTCVKELGICRLKKLCELSFKKFDKKYIFQVLDITRKHDLGTQYFEAFWYICSNFDECIQLNGFLELQYHLMLEILTEDTIKKRNETLLFDRLLKYIVHNRVSLEKNTNYIPNLLKKIDFSKINLNDMNYLLMDKKFLFLMKNCYTVLSEALRTAKQSDKLIQDKYRSNSIDVPRNNNNAKF